MQPLPEQMGVRAESVSPPPAGPQLLCSLSVSPLRSWSVCCRSCVASCVCVGFAKSLQSILSAENIPPPLPFVLLPKMQRGLRRGSVPDPHVPALAVGGLY